MTDGWMDGGVNDIPIAFLKKSVGIKIEKCCNVEGYFRDGPKLLQVNYQ